MDIGIRFQRRKKNGWIGFEKIRGYKIKDRSYIKISKNI